MKRLLIAAALTLTASGALWAQSKTIEQIAARVNTAIILKSDVDRETEIRRADIAERVTNKEFDAATAQKYFEEAKAGVLRDLIDRELLVQVAKEAGLSADLEVFKTMEQLRVERKYATMEELEKAILKDYGDLEEFKNDIRAKVLGQKVIQHEVYGRVNVTQEQERKYYDEHQKEFDKPAGVSLSEIVVLMDPRVPEQVAAQRKKAEEALAAVKKGEDFADVARKYSEVPDAQDGGYMGFITAELDARITKAIANLAKGQTTEIVEAPDGFEIYKVTDRHNGGILTFELAEQLIYSDLMQDLAPPKIRDFLTKLREENFVDVKDGYKDLGAIEKKAKATASK
jgi:peptidyl-prolyl cis-trans isomerase SurA